MQTQLFPSDPYAHAQDIIPGFCFFPDFLMPDAAMELLQAVDAEPWLADLKRRVQHYGYKYDYKRRNIDLSMRIGALPDWAQPIAERLRTSGHLPFVPDQLIVNEYQPGQGIANHVDCEPCFEDGIVSISLGTPYIMTFTEKADREHAISLLLPPRSMIIFSGEARYDWLHGIKGIKTDQWQGRKIQRGRRVSLTFRKVILGE